MDKARHDLLADARFAKDQHGHVGPCDVARDVNDPQHLRVRSQDISLFHERQLLFQRLNFLFQPFFFDRIFDGKFERFFLKRFCQIVGDSDLHGFDHGFNLADSGKDNDRNHRVDRLHRGQYFDPVLAGKHDVQQYHRRRGTGGKPFDGLVARTETVHRIP